MSQSFTTHIEYNFRFTYTLSHQNKKATEYATSETKSVDRSESGKHFSSMKVNWYTYALQRKRFADFQGKFLSYKFQSAEKFQHYHGCRLKVKKCSKHIHKFCVLLYV